MEENLDWEKLTERQRRWIDFYIETGNATEASKKAGYKGKNPDNIGSENLRKLAPYLRAKMQAKDNERIASQNEVLEFLTKIMRGEEKDAFGLDISIQDRIKCAELLGKRYGTFVDRKDISATGGITVKLIDDVHE